MRIIINYEQLSETVLLILIDIKIIMTNIINYEWYNKIKINMNHIITYKQDNYMNRLQVQ